VYEPTYDAVTGTVTGSLDGYGPSRALAGVNVSVFSGECSSAVLGSAGCGLDNWTLTNLSGQFLVRLLAGNYSVVALPDASLSGAGAPDGFGGTALDVSVPATDPLNLTVYPDVPYDNATLVLPGYVCDSAYLNEHGGYGPGCVSPVLSWTQSGAYYLTISNELVFDSFSNASTRAVATWVPLYQSFPSYAMIPNELFITQDGSYIYSWGTLTSSSTTITAEAVNVTTGRLFEYNFTGITTGSVASNGQAQLTGWDGNDSQFCLILSDGQILDHPLWSATQLSVGTLGYFEANNVYWEPYLNAYIDLEAGGSSADGISEWQLAGPTNLSLERTYNGYWGSGITVNGVNGISFNVTSRQLSLRVEWSGITYSVNGTGVLSNLLEVTNRYPAGIPPPAVPLGPASESDRPTLEASGPILGSDYSGWGNDSWLVSMTPGHLGFYSTNVSPDFPNGKIAGVPVYSWNQWAQAGQFYNASYLIAPDSYTCASALDGACTIDGGEGAAIGTIWWMWRAGSPEFPETSSAPAADALDPGPTPVVGAATTNRSIDLTWTAPAGGPIINYTVAAQAPQTPAQSVSVNGSSDSATISGLATGTEYRISVEAWNLHYHGNATGTSSALTLGPTPPVPLAPANVSRTSIEWRWIEAANESITNYTIEFFGNGACTGSFQASTLAGDEGEFTTAGLTSNTTYSVAVFSWNATGESSPSTCRSASTLQGVPYSVVFAEKGLPKGALWNVTAGGTYSSAIATAQTLLLPNGTYGFHVGVSVGGYATGTFNVSGAATKISLQFYEVTFRETGLKARAMWSTEVGLLSVTTNETAFELYLTDGSYAYSFGGVSGYRTPPSGTLLVAGAKNTVRVKFQKGGPPIPGTGFGPTQGAAARRLDPTP
jgi:hypothetical protein